MADFRSTFYDQYVSKFTRQVSGPDDAALEQYWAWCRFKYLPLFRDLNKNDNILELGCGPGYFIKFLQMSGFTNARGIDVSSEQVEIAKAQGLNVEKADVFQFLEQNAESFSAIVALDFIEHFTKAESLALAKLFHKSLKKGGLLILQTPNGEGLFPQQVMYGDLTHLTVFTPGSLRQLLSVEGFDDFKFFETGPVAKNLYGRVRLLLWNMITLGAKAIRKIEAGKSQDIWTENLICYCRKA